MLDSVRQPGDFQRHPHTGAPYVTHPTETTKAGVAKRVLYGRPSSFGKKIEDATNLQKWAERAVILGVHLERCILEPLTHLPADQLTLDHPDTGVTLDTAAATAKRAAKALLSAERGTHTHLLAEDHDTGRDWTARAAAGEHLGLPVPVQAALVDAWHRLLDDHGLEVLAVEQTCVDDQWRLAGTLDRIVKLGQELQFVESNGEIVNIPTGTVVVLDIKTGQLRADSGVVDWWNSYAVQIASYAQSVPYDVDTDERGVWPWTIQNGWALIAHLDVNAALAGEAVAKLILVDVAAGREAGDLCYCARDWERRRDVFSRTDNDQMTVRVPVIDAALPSPDDAFVQTAIDIGMLDEQTRLELRSQWPANTPYPTAVATGRATWTREQHVAIVQLVDRCDPFRTVHTEPAPPRARVEPVVPVVDDGGPSDAASVDALLAMIKQSDVADVLNGWLAEARSVGESWNPRVRRTVRSFEITRAAFALAEYAWDGTTVDVDLAYNALLHASGVGCAGEWHPLRDEAIGAALAFLTIDEARTLANIVHA